MINNYPNDEDYTRDDIFRDMARLGRGCLVIAFIIAILSIGMCASAMGQEVFRFNTSTVVMVDTTGRMDTGFASWPVIASGDTLTIAAPAGPLVWWGIKWIPVDNGDLYCIAPNLRARYSPGPGGQSMALWPVGRMRVIELYEKTERQ